MIELPPWAINLAGIEFACLAGIVLGVVLRGAEAKRLREQLADRDEQIAGLRWELDQYRSAETMIR